MTTVENDYNISVLVDTELKEQAEQILEQLGITMSEAIGMFLRQVVSQQELPLACRILTKEELDAMMEEGLVQARAGLSKPVDVAFAELRRRFDL